MSLSGASTTPPLLYEFHHHHHHHQFNLWIFLGACGWIWFLVFLTKHLFSILKFFRVFVLVFFVLFFFLWFLLAISLSLSLSLGVGVAADASDVLGEIVCVCILDDWKGYYLLSIFYFIFYY